MDIDTKFTKMAPGKDTLVLTGGGNDVYLFQRLAEDLNLSNIQVGTVKGDQQFARTLKDINNLPYVFTQIKSLGLVRDADSDPKKAFDQVCCDLSQAGFPVPTAPDKSAVGTPNVTVHLFPGEMRPGVLEMLCLETVSNKPQYACVEEYFDCLRTKGIAIPEHKLAKAKAHAYLASCPDPVAGVGVGFLHSKNYWDMTNPAWHAARAFLQLL